MLKKAGIIVAAAAATLLAVSPLAFADVSGDHNNGSGSAGHSTDHTSMALVNISGNNVNGNVNGACNNDVALGGVALQKAVPAQAVLGALAPSTTTDNLTTDDGRGCGLSGTSAGNSAR